jgi:hypothetical protein
MRMTCLSVAISLALGSSAAFAQQLPGTAGETIGHPPSIAGPPSASDTSVAPRSGTAAPMGGPSEPTATGVNVSPAAPPASPGGSVPAGRSGDRRIYHLCRHTRYRLEQEETLARAAVDRKSSATDHSAMSTRMLLTRKGWREIPNPRRSITKPASPT